MRVRGTDQGPEFNPLFMPPPAVEAPLDPHRIGGVGGSTSPKMFWTTFPMPVRADDIMG